MELHYSYQPLNEELEEIRLLRIDTTKVQKQIRCTVKHVSMKAKPKYIALSYTWDNPLGKANQADERGETILVNKRPFHTAKSLAIRHNLACALRTLPHGISRWYWIDAICLNQSDVAERNKQVSRMGIIYSRASKVIVWLGPANDNSHLAIALIHKIAKQITIDDEIEAIRWTKNTLIDETYRHSWSAYINLLKRTWWRRAWVVQEMTLAKKLEMWCGAAQLDWRSLADTIDLVRTLNLVEFFGPFHAVSEQDLLTDAMTAIMFQTFTRRRLVKGETLPLLYVLAECRTTLATDNRDKLFAMLSFVRQNEQDLVVTDYNLSVRNLYICFAKKYIETTRDLQIITLAQENHSTDFPSWVPDWSRISIQIPFSIKLISGLDLAAEFSTHKGTRSRCHFSDEMQAMICQGICFDNVDGLGVYKFPGIETKDGEGVQSSTTESAYGTAGQTFEAIWRSSCANIELLPDRFDFLGNFGAHFAKAWLDISGNEEANVSSASELPTKHAQDFSDFSFLRLGDRTIRDFVLEASESSQTCEQAEITEHRWAELAYRMNLVKDRRRFLITGQGYVGWVPRCTRKGDKVFILFGCGVPVILRPQGDAFQLVGECYVHGIMYGEAIEDLEKGKYQMQDVTIV